MSLISRQIYKREGEIVSRFLKCSHLGVEAVSRAGRTPTFCLDFSPSRAQQAVHCMLGARDHYQLLGKGKQYAHSCPPPADLAEGQL